MRISTTRSRRHGSDQPRYLSFFLFPFPRLFFLASCCARDSVTSAGRSVGLADGRGFSRRRRESIDKHNLHRTVLRAWQGQRTTKPEIRRLPRESGLGEFLFLPLFPVSFFHLRSTTFTTLRTMRYPSYQVVKPG